MESLTWVSYFGACLEVPWGGCSRNGLLFSWTLCPSSITFSSYDSIPSYYLMQAYYIPGTVLSALQIESHLILTLYEVGIMIKRTQTLEQLGFESWLSNYANSGTGSFMPQFPLL